MSTTKRIRSASSSAVSIWLLDVLGEVVAVDHADAAGVDQLEEPGIGVVADLDQGADPVAGHARHVVDDGDPASGEPVEQRRLADVRPADDDDLGEGHGTHHNLSQDAMAQARQSSEGG